MVMNISAPCGLQTNLIHCVYAHISNTQECNSICRVEITGEGWGERGRRFGGKELHSPKSIGMLFEFVGILVNLGINKGCFTSLGPYIFF